MRPLGRNRSKFEDHYSQTIVQNQPSYLKETNDLVSKIENIKDETKDSTLCDGRKIHYMPIIQIMNVYNM